MFTPPKLSREQPNTYAMQSASGNEELKRLQLQDHMITVGMGGVLPELPDPARFQRVLDIGCGSGDWLLETARTYPTISQLIGVDVNPKMVNYARGRAKALSLDGRVAFYRMDAMRRLEFPDASFDLVNERFGASWLRNWDWPHFLYECQRVLRPGGVVRVTEPKVDMGGNSPALTRLAELTTRAFYQAGNFFTLESDGITGKLACLLHQHGFQHVETHAHVLEYRAGTPEGESFAEDYKHFYRALLPFLHKWIRVPDDYRGIYQQMLHEMQQPDFVARWTLLTAWGTKSPTFSLPREY
ncbi:MAG TPA: class I SAM-dependent methyltransferase [Ktedonobacteraceae bacterium]|nr:class I SAM-dependent methyltransferase [Ktedonobacteraceae bacterium]